MPKGGASSLIPVYAGIRDDLDDFLKAFLLLKTQRYIDYKELFNRRGMTQIFNGRSCSAEIIEFNEYLLVYCLPYLEEYVCPKSPRSLEERIFGLYTMYTFFYLQKVDHVVKIRVDPDAARNFRNFMALLLSLQIYDAYAACVKLLNDRAFKNCAFISVYDLTYFKRFDTDEKVYGVKIRTNLNDPLSGVKEIVNSPIFSKLGLIHKAYMKKKEEVGVKEIKGTPKLKDLQNVCKQILEQNSRRAEFLTGVEETINTDFTMEQVGNRKELRTEIKERAYGHDMLLTRSRRHRTSIPLVMPTDSFDYEMEPIRAPEIVNDDVKHVKPEYTATEGKPSRRIPRRCGRKRKNPSPPPPPPPKKLRGRKSTKKANVREDSDRKVKTEISKRKGKGRKVLEPSIVKKPKSEKTDDSQGILVSTPEPECVANNLATPTRSIIKKRGKTPVTGNRHVSFLENTAGELDNIIHSIPSRHDSSESDTNVDTVQEDVQTSNGNCRTVKSERIADSYMFEPLENEAEILAELEGDGFDVSFDSEEEEEDDE